MQNLTQSLLLVSLSLLVSYGQSLASGPKFIKSNKKQKIVAISVNLAEQNDFKSKKFISVFSALTAQSVKNKKVRLYEKQNQQLKIIPNRLFRMEKSVKHKFEEANEIIIHQKTIYKNGEVIDSEVVGFSFYKRVDDLPHDINFGYVRMDDLKKAISKLEKEDPQMATMFNGMLGIVESKRFYYDLYSVQGYVFGSPLVADFFKKRKNY